MNLSGIKNIIFDLGGVILNIDPYLTYQAFADFGLGSVQELLKNEQLKQILLNYEIGAINDDQLFNAIRNESGNQKLSNSAIRDAWNSMILDIPNPRLDLLLQLKENYRTFLLSNTNAIHLDYYNGNLKQETGNANLSTYFEMDYYSHLMRMRKPNPDIFLKVLNDNNLIAEETLFMDDFKINIEAAEKLGIKTYLKDAKKEFVEIF